MNSVAGWARDHKLAFIIAGVWVFFGLLYVTPPTASVFAWQRLLTGVGFLVHGVSVLLPILVSKWVQDPLVYPVSFIAVGLIGLAVGLYIESLWKLGTVGKAIVVPLVLMNACAGLFVAFAADVVVGNQYADCERLVSDTSGIRVMAYPEYGVVPGGHFFFLATNDAGKSWEQIMDFRHDDPVEPPCENLRAHGPGHMSVWMGWKMATTNDGGESWKVLNLIESFPDYAWGHHGLIVNVGFEDNLNGCILLHPTAWHGPNPVLCTEDGGKTWEVKE